MGKAAIAVISLILVVGAVVGTVVYVKQSHGNGKESGGIAAGTKAVDTICAPTDHKDLCKETLSPVAQGDASPLVLIEAAFNATMKAVKKALNDSLTLDKDVKEEYDSLSLDGCKRYMEFAVEDLEIAISKVLHGEMKSMSELVNELNVWLSAVLSYKETCVEELENPKLKEALGGGLLNTTALTENALAIVDGIGDFLEKLDFKLPSLTQRRLLNEMGPEGFPTWLSAADRKLLQTNTNPKPNVVVAKDGSGQFKTIGEALASYPKKHQGRYVIYVKEGVYQEYVEVTTKMINVYMYGDGPKKTIVTGDKNFGIKHIPTSQTATFKAFGNGFIAANMGFENTAGPKGHQAVALLVKGDMAAFFNCRMDGYQDTLYYQAHRQFYRSCVISGTVDFIFGRGTAVIQNSEIVVRMPDLNQHNCVTADGKSERHERTGLVLQNCVIVAEPELQKNKQTIKTYLGRPWGQYATTMIMESDIPDFVAPEGYLAWNVTHPNTQDSEYREYANRGPGANTNLRVKWPSFLVADKNKAVEFTAGTWIRGDQWLKDTGAPFDLGFSQ